MRILNKRYWSIFFDKKKDSFNGKLFENLVGVLLHEQFSNLWVQTQTTWDGGKDFKKVHDDGDGYSWAECKIYGKLISIRAISNTLVMAVNEENVKEILIFSYSKLNDNALNHLGDFSATTDIKINVFDDERLELLILKSKNILSKYFNGIKVSAYKIAPFFISSSLSNTPHIERAMLNDQQGILKARNPIFEVNSTCLFEIFIVANEKITLNFDFKKISENIELLGVLNYQYLPLDEVGNVTLKLSGGRIESIKLYFAPSKAGTFNFPKIQTRNSINDEIVKLGEIEYEVSRLRYPPLIGGKLLSFLENDFRAKISANNQLFCLTISGKSGVGKTRFLNECKKLLFSENFSVRHFDCNSVGYQNHNNFVRSLLAQLWRLPYPIIPDVEDVFDQSKNANKETVYDQIYYLLYDKEVDLFSEEKLETLCTLIVNGLLKQRMALIIDNVQHLAETSINFLQMLYCRLVNSPGQNVLLLSFNKEDLLFSNSALSFHMFIKESASKRIENELFYELEEFNENQIEQFLNSVLKNDDPEDEFTNHYPTLTKLIKENVLPRPLDLWQFILAAKDQEVVSLDEGYFFIKDEVRFIELIKTIQKNTEAIFEYRLNKLSSEMAIVEILYLIANMGDVNTYVLNYFGHSDEVIQKLVDIGILNYSAGERIEFYHPSIEKFIFKKINQPAFVEMPRRIEIFKKFMIASFSSSFPVVCFLLNPEPKDDEIIAMIKLFQTTTQGFPSDQMRFAAKKTREYLIYCRTIAPAKYIDIVNLLCTISAKDGNKTDWLKYMNEFRNKLKDFTPETKIQAMQYFYIIREIYSASMSADLASETINELENTITEMRIKLNSLPEEVFYELRANFMNRQCVCYKNLREPSKALKIGEEARDIAIESGAYGLACLCIVDLGYVYFAEDKNEEKILAFWDNAIEFYNLNQSIILEQIPAMEHVILLIEGCCYGLRGKYKQSVKCLDKLVNDCYKEGSLFYLLQGKLTKAIMISRELLEVNKLEQLPYSFSNAIDIAKAVEDSSAASGMVQFYRYSLHLQAVVWGIIGQYDKAGVCFSGLLKILSFQESKKPGTLSFNDEMILWDALDFQNSEKSHRDLKHLLDSFLSKGIPKSKEDITDRPYSVFSVGKFNLPMH